MNRDRCTMSKINDAIDRIAICTEERKYPSLILDYVFQGTDKTTLEEFTDKEIASITPKRLSEKYKILLHSPLNPPNMGDFQLRSPQTW